MAPSWNPPISPLPPCLRLFACSIWELFLEKASALFCPSLWALDGSGVAASPHLLGLVSRWCWCSLAQLHTCVMSLCGIHMKTWPELHCMRLGACVLLGKSIDNLFDVQCLRTQNVGNTYTSWRARDVLHILRIDIVWTYTHRHTFTPTRAHSGQSVFSPLKKELSGIFI